MILGCVILSRGKNIDPCVPCSFEGPLFYTWVWARFFLVGVSGLDVRLARVSHFCGLIFLVRINYVFGVSEIYQGSGWPLFIFRRFLISSDEKPYSSSVTDLKFETLGDLKYWLGVSDNLLMLVS